MCLPKELLLLLTRLSYRNSGTNVYNQQKRFKEDGLKNVLDNNQASKSEKRKSVGVSENNLKRRE